MKLTFHIHEPLLDQLMRLTKKSRQGTIELIADYVKNSLPAKHEIDVPGKLRREAVISGLEFNIVWPPHMAFDVRPRANVMRLNEDEPTAIDGAFVSCACEDGKTVETAILAQKDLATMAKKLKAR